MAKPAIILLALVVAPTAVLSFLAGSALKNWEAELHRRFEAGAARARRDVATRLLSDMESDWWKVQAAVEGALAPRGRWQDIETVTAGLAGTARLATNVMVFMDPLGFVFPGGDATGIPAHHQETGPDRERLTQTLREHIVRTAGAAFPIRTLALRFDGELYCFGPLRYAQGLYVGYQVRGAPFRERLEGVLTDLAGSDFVLSAHDDIANDAAAVVVDDPFFPPRYGGPEVQALPTETARLRVAAALPAPLEFITVTATLRDPAQTVRAAVWRSRLLGWGIVLFSLSVVLGGLLIFSQVITEARRAHEQRDLVMEVSHDLRTPIASIKMMMESLYLEHVRDAGRRREFMRTVISESDRLADMIERVLMLLRQDRRALAYSMQPFDPAELAQAVVAIYRERVAPADHVTGEARIRLDVAEGIPTVRGDRRALFAVLSNLLDNALTHGAPPLSATTDAACATILASVTVESVRRCGRPRVCLAVRDYGRGIPRREIGRIFRRFYRGHSNTDTPAGTGLGLALCRDIIKAHGGRILVDSEPGCGSVFRVFLRTTGRLPA